MIELKRCPFCGGEARLFVNNGVRVICPKCQASTKVMIDGEYGRNIKIDAISSVVKAWNRRTSDDGLH